MEYEVDFCHLITSVRLSCIVRTTPASIIKSSSNKNLANWNTMIPILIQMLFQADLVLIWKINSYHAFPKAAQFIYMTPITVERLSIKKTRFKSNHLLQPMALYSHTTHIEVWRNVFNKRGKRFWSSIIKSNWLISSPRNQLHCRFVTFRLVNLSTSIQPVDQRPARGDGIGVEGGS